MSEGEKTVKPLIENGDDVPAPLFSSVRERRLWLWTLAVLVGIYSTLGLARTLAGILRDQGMLANTVLFSMILIGVGVLVQGLRRRPGGTEIGVALGIAAVYILMFLRMSVPLEERTHLMEYTVVALLIYEALMERASNGRRVPVPALLAIVATALFGLLDEGIQAFIPSRVFDPIDILFNTLAGLMAVLASVVLAWARRLGTKDGPKGAK
jgi:hypothetical protein